MWQNYLNMMYISSGDNDEISEDGLRNLKSDLHKAIDKYINKGE